MAIPDFQTLMLPVLQFAADKADHTNKDLVEHICERFGLSEEDRKATIPSGRQALVLNRVAWARSYLKIAGLLDTPKHGVFRITTRGLTTLHDKPERIDLKFLRKFPEYLAWRTGSAERTLENADTGENSSASTALPSPEEQMDAAFEALRQAVAADIRERLLALSPKRFEVVVVDLLVAMGYGGSRRDAAEVTGKSGDEGIDGLIKEDRLGLDVVYVQAKKWSNSVGRPDVQRFVGALSGQHARKGVFITTSEFTKESREYAAKTEAKVVLIDGRELAQLMIDHGIGVSTAEKYEIKRVDSDYFEED
jgi:restriction system protein